MKTRRISSNDIRGNPWELRLEWVLLSDCWQVGKPAEVVSGVKHADVRVADFAAVFGLPQTVDLMRWPAIISRKRT